MWRKRQAQASDQQSWRALGTDSALWKGIEKNSGNVKVALGAGNTSTTGIVTGIKLVKTEGLEWTATAGQSLGDFYISDPSNAAIAVEDGINRFGTNCPTGTSGKNLAISFVKYGSEDFKTQAVPHDISGIKYHILNGGQGYKVGDQFTVLQGTNQYGKQVTIDGSITGATVLTAGAAVQQEAYKITDIACTPGGTGTAGAAVVLTLSSGGTANGFLVADVNGASTSIQVISALDQLFDSTLGTGLTIANVTVTGLSTGVENTRKAAVNGFITNQSGGGIVANPEFYQTLAQFQTTQFEKVFSKYVTGGTTVITATSAEASGTIGTDDLEFDAPAFANPGKINAALIIKGRLSAQVTSITSTKIEPGRN